MGLFSRKSASLQSRERQDIAEAQLQDLLALFADDDDERSGSTSWKRPGAFTRKASPARDGATPDDN